VSAQALDPFAFPVLEGEPEQTSPLAREQALAAAHARAEAAAAEAAARARDEGFAAGLADAEEHIAPLRSALVAAVRTLEQHVEDAAVETERRAVELALALAEKILHTALDADPSLVVPVVTGALRRVANRETIVLDVNPADVDLVRAATGQIQSELGNLPRLEVAGERRVARGGCVVRTVEGEIDARLDTQLARAAEVLRASVTPDA
jgi:flagellar assembly protein FliH